MAGRPFASTKSIVTTELQICDFKRRDASASLGLRWKYCKYVKALCYEHKWGGRKGEKTDPPKGKELKEEEDFSL